MRKSNLKLGPRRGLTLLELVIILMVFGIIFFIALPTLRPSSSESLTEFAKTELRYLWTQENAYFTRRGSYVAFSKLAADPDLGSSFDKRFATDQPLVKGIRFSFPTAGGALLEITADLPDGTSYIIDQRGEVKQYQSQAKVIIPPPVATP